MSVRGRTDAQKGGAKMVHPMIGADLPVEALPARYSHRTMKRRPRRPWLFLLLIPVILAGLVACVPPPPTGAVPLKVSTVVSGLSMPWDVGWLPDHTMLFTQRASGLYMLKNGVPVRLTDGGSDFWAAGETGMMALEVDPHYEYTGRVYTCQGSTERSWTGQLRSVKVVAWEISPGTPYTARHADDVVTGIDATTGQHGGCALAWKTISAPPHLVVQELFVGTGDAAYGTNPQNLTSLGGKVLCADVVEPRGGTNLPCPDLPFGNVHDPRIQQLYTYGHRNVQGLAFRANGELWSTDQGPGRDDEINRLHAGDNYGWDPVPLPYNETAPMTNFAKYPRAAGPQWTSGPTSVEPGGITFLSGPQWKQWDGALAVATSKDMRLRVQFYSDLGIFRGEVFPAQFNHTFGRLRAVEQGPDGCLYITTANGTNDKIIKACPA
jgi:glucose/arabinose dehydrogenase